MLPSDSGVSSSVRWCHFGSREWAWAGLFVAMLGLLMPVAAVRALEIVAVKTSRDGPAYLLHIEALFAASPERLLAVLTDYDRIHELHPQMLESRSLGPVGPATEEVYTRFEGCVLFFCRTLDRVERILVKGGSLYAQDVPGRGSFQEGRTTWRLQATGAGTRLHYEARFVPAFRVGLVIGPAVLARSVERMAIQTMKAAEKRAATRDE